MIVAVVHPDARAICAAIDARGLSLRAAPVDHIAEASAVLESAEVVFTSEPPAELWHLTPRVRVVQMMGAGIDHVLPAANLRAEAVITNARGVFAADAAEHAFGLLLALVHRLPSLLDRQRARVWSPSPCSGLSGKRCVIVGTGEIGRRVAAFCRAGGASVTGVNRRGRPVEGFDEIVTTARLDESFRGADAVVLVVPRTPETLGLVGARAIACLGRTAFFVDVSRGGIVDEAALLEAVAAGRLGGVARDVFDVEPLPEGSPWWSAPNTIVTPHVAGWGMRYLERTIDLLADNVDRLERGAPLRNVVDRAAGY